MKTNSIMNQTVDEFLESTGVGSGEKALGNAMYGLNHTNLSPGIPLSKSTYGWTFFTRPQLNMRSENLRRVRVMYPLLTNKEYSIARYIRCMLDPRLGHNLIIRGDSLELYNKEIITSPLVDNKNAFIPILSNSIKTMSGWPDEVIPNWTSSQGRRREQTGFVDGTYEINEAFDINATFENHMGDIIYILFQTWIRYSSLVFEGTMVPYLDMLLENEIDYNTRIYRITTDNTWSNLNYIAATGAAFPRSIPSGKLFDLDTTKVYSDQTKELSVNFKAFGALYNDDILIKEFNDTNAIFNPDYKAYINGDKTAMAPIPNELSMVLNFRGYPYINPDNYRIEWLIPTHGDLFKKLNKRFGIIKDSEIDELIGGI